MKETIIVYLPLDPKKAKISNLPVKLPILAEDLDMAVKKNQLSPEIILRGLEAQVKTGKDLDYYLSYYLYMLYDRARNEINLRNFTKAREYVQKAAEYKKDYRYPFHLGIIEREEGNLDKSELLLREAVNLNDDFIPARLELARTLLSKNEVDDAIEVCKEIIEIDPKFPLAYIVMGDAYLKIGDAKSSLALYQQALSIDKDLPATHWRIGVAANMLQKFSLAQREFNISISKGEGGWHAKYNLSYALYRLGEIVESLEILKSLWEEGIEAPEVITEIVLNQKLLGLYEEALDFVERGMEMGISEKGFLLGAMDIYAFNRLTDKALKIYEEHQEKEFETRKRLIELEKECKEPEFPNLQHFEKFIKTDDENLRRRLEEVKSGILPPEKMFNEDILAVFVKVVKKYGKCPYLSERILTQSGWAFSGFVETVGLFLFLYRIYLAKNVFKEDISMSLESAIDSVVDVSWKVGKQVSATLEKDVYDLEEMAPQKMKSPSEAATFFAMALHLLDGHPHPIEFLKSIGTSDMKLNVLECLLGNGS